MYIPTYTRYNNDNFTTSTITKQYIVVVLISSKVIIPLHGWPHCIASQSFNFVLPAELLSKTQLNES